MILSFPLRRRHLRSFAGFALELLLLVLANEVLNKCGCNERETASKPHAFSSFAEVDPGEW
jgi:hypothetical protein